MDIVTLKRVLEPWFGWMPDWMVAVCGFTLRCELREKLIGYIQSEFPNALPRYRAEFGAQALLASAHMRAV
jgi:hypothetical protein